MTEGEAAVERIRAALNGRDPSFDETDVGVLLQEYDLEKQNSDQLYRDLWRWVGRKRSQAEQRITWPALGGMLMAGIMAMSFLVVIGR